MSQAILEDVCKTYPMGANDLAVLRNVSITFQNGESVAVMGPSGAGKSTLLNILGTLESPTSGNVTLNQRNPFSLSEKALAGFRNQTIGFIFQDHHLLPQCSALENVLLPTLISPDRSTALDRAKSLLEKVGLADRLNHTPAELSGGERQRVAIARALINRPTLLLADEPTGNLDQTTAKRVVEVIFDLQRQEGVTLVCVTHDNSLADQFDRCLVLVDGSLDANK